MHLNNLQSFISVRFRSTQLESRLDTQVPIYLMKEMIFVFFCQACKIIFYSIITIIPSLNVTL